jgi:membrane-bound lytic murein transglycosylase D
VKDGINSIFMKKTKKIRFRLHGFFCFAAILFSGMLPAYSQYSYITIDTAAFSDDSVAAKELVTEASNVEFPDILKGSEEASLDYIEKFSVRRRDYLIRMYTKGKKLLPKAAGILKKHNLPEELKVLMILESAYNAKAVSKAGAVGYWQFMDAVAKEYGLKYVAKEVKEETVTVKKVIKKRGRKIVVEKKAKVKKDVTERKGKKVDDRTNFNKSTVAAARYLRDRRANLDDNWLLVVASYNWGIGNVWNAMEKCGKENPTFWDIKQYLPEETKAYVMNFITLNVIYKNYDKFLKNKLVFKTAKPTLPADNFEENIAEELESGNTASLK